MSTLHSATLDLAKVVASVLEGTATGGSATTVVDNVVPDQPDDYWTKGTIWMLSGLNAGKARRITTWDLTPTTTFTFPTMTSVNAAGDRYAVAHKDYPLWLLRQAVNEALKNLGDLPQTNATLTTVADQEKYDLPAGVQNIYRVEIATETSAPYDYQPSYNWREYGSDLLFDTDHEPIETGLLIRLWYKAAHAELTADTDDVSDYVHRELLKWEAAVIALRWKLKYHMGDDPTTRDLLNEAIANRELERRRHSVMVDINPDPKYGKW